MQQFTKSAIIQTFIELLNHKPLSKITVKEIVDTCGISRNTFYYHYQDIYALLDEIFRDEVNKAIKQNHTFDSWNENFTESIRFVIENKTAILHIYNSINRRMLESYLYEMTDLVLDSFIEHTVHDVPYTPENKRFVMSFYRYAIVGLITEWVDSNMKEDPSSYIDKINLIFEGSIELALKRSCGEG